MEQIIFHIDVNSAFLSWSALALLAQGSKTDIRKIPAIIGGDIERRHGIVLAKSVPAKKYGITTGEPIVNAMRKCPNLTIESPDHKLYQQKSSELMDFLSQICPDIEQVSIDECYMDYTPIAHRYPTPADAANSIRNEVKKHFGFTVNIGISDRKILAKMASDFEKPDKVHTLYSYEIKTKLWPLPVSSLFMCGKSSVQTLLKLEIKTIGDLAKADPSVLTAHLKSHGITLWEYANGIDRATVEVLPAEVKGIGNSTTLSQDVTDRSEACKTLLWLAESVGKRLREANQLAGMVSVEIKYNNFRSVSHQTTLELPSDSTQLLYQTACSLFDELWDKSPIRLLGLRTAKLCDNSVPLQMSLFDFSPFKTNSGERETLEENTSAAPSPQKLAALDKSLDDIRRKYGDNAIIRGSLLNSPGPHKH